MIDKIEMYKVGFGDCFICSDNEEKYKMLVDCGSLVTIPHSIMQEISTSLANTRENYLMITHFHDDHFNGLKNLHGSINFSEIYLPNFFTRSIITLQFIALAGCNPQKLPNNSKNFKRRVSINSSYNFALNLLTSIPSIANHFINGTRVIFMNKLYGIHKNYRYKNYLDNLRILWPDMGYGEQYANKLIEIIAPELSEDSYTKLNNYVDRFIDIIMRTNENGVLYFYKESIGELSEIFNLVRESQEALKIRLSKSQRRKISSFQNKLCLCFDNIGKNNKKPVLFLSDITKAHYRNLVKINHLAEHYSAIKVPHHGTPSHFIGYLPDSDCLLIPNDDKIKNKRICSHYSTNYALRSIFPNSPNCILSRSISNNCTGNPLLFCTHIL